GCRGARVVDRNVANGTSPREGPREREPGAKAPDANRPRKRRFEGFRGRFCGEGGIRTLGTPIGVRRFSKPVVSATHPPLRGCNCGALAPLPAPARAA